MTFLTRTADKGGAYLQCSMQLSLGQEAIS